MADKDVVRRLERIEEHVLQIKVDIATLKVKAGIWGALAGLIPATVAILLS